MDAHKNFAYSLVATAPSPAASGTSLVVTAGQGALFPAVPFNATVWPAASQPTTLNAEVVRVTGRSTDTLTITRAQESSSARTVVVGDQIAATVTAKTLTDVEASLVPDAGAASQVVGYASAKVGQWLYPPGFEIGYTEITSSVNVTGTTSAAATTVLSPGALTFDGAPVLLEVFSPQILCDSSNVADLFQTRLFEGSTEIGVLSRVRSLSTATTNVSSLHVLYRFTPSAGSHTYTIKCTVASTTGTPSFGAGSGGTDTLLPAFVRFRKV